MQQLGSAGSESSGKALSEVVQLGEDRSLGTASPASPSEQLQALLTLQTWFLVVLLPPLGEWLGSGHPSLSHILQHAFGVQLECFGVG